MVNKAINKELLKRGLSPKSNHERSHYPKRFINGEEKEMFNAWKIIH